MYNQVRIVSTKVVEEDWNLKAYLPLQVALPMCSAKELTSDVVVVAYFRSFQLIRFKLLAAYLAARRMVKLRFLVNVKTILYQVAVKHINDFLFPLD